MSYMDKNLTTELQQDIYSKTDETHKTHK